MQAFESSLFVFDFCSEPHIYILSGPLAPKLDVKPQAFTALPIKKDGSIA